ncbi:MAG: SufS family cysteine desulfurase, partial [Elusimicrobia bacterium]|nr:SufS family cysteine desulfurase [Elusimicrobiota bacterium]
MKAIDPKIIRKDFPIFSRSFGGRPLVYLDSTATTQKPNAVIDALVRFYRESNANIHRGVYPLAEEATNLYEAARERVARFINAPSRDEVIFTRNTTESINLVALTWGRANIKAGDEILITQLEHHANFVPWYMLAKECGAKLKVAPLDSHFNVDLDAFRKLVSPKTKLVAVTAMSNVLGTITPIKEMISMAKANGSTVLVDAAQSAPHFKTDVQLIDADFLAFSAHKMLGPTGVGVLWGRKELLEAMPPFNTGGEMISIVSVDEVTWADVPHKFEAGTPNFADAAAFPPALDYLDRLGMDAVRAHEKELLAYAIERLREIPDLTLYGPLDPEKQGGVISF